MAALPGLTSISLTKDRTKALVSVSSLVLRNSLISAAKVAMVSALSGMTRRSARIALASSAAISKQIADCAVDRGGCATVPTTMPAPFV